MTGGDTRQEVAVWRIANCLSPFLAIKPRGGSAKLDRLDFVPRLQQDAAIANQVELKLFFPAAALARIEAHPLIAGVSRKVRAEVLESTYFDTPDLVLRGARISVRTRKTGTGMLQTVKCVAESLADLSSRSEWEQAFDGDFDFAAIDAEDVRTLLDAEKSHLLPICTTVFRRETRLVEPREGVSILIMIDTGTIISADDQEHISELKLGLVQGTTLDLQSLVIDLAADLPLIAFDQSKAERGYRLFYKEPARPMKSSRAAIIPSATPLQTFHALASQGQKCWQANLHGALSSSDPEFVHQFRVALRRLNTLLKVFKPALPGDFFAAWSDSLKKLAGITGEIRDLDVMREAILLPMRHPDCSSEHEALVERALLACDKARETAGPAFDQLSDGLPLLTFARDINRLPLGASKQKTARFAEKRLARMHLKAVNRRLAVVKNPTPENAHHFRIALKHLRYSCEFFASLFDEVAMLAFAKGVAALQDEFGFINDLHVALRRFDQWSRQEVALVEVHDCIAKWYSGRIDARLGLGLDCARSLLRQSPPWRGACEMHG